MRRSFAWSWILPLVAAACSSNLGSGGFDIPAEGVTAPIPCAEADDPRPSDACPETPTVARGTAKALVETLLPIAAAAYGTGTRWAGTLQGRDLGRDGRPSGAAVSGWATAFCLGGSVLEFDVTGGVCAARNLCDCQSTRTCAGNGCDAASDKPFPQVDSGQAISAAFPDDVDGLASYDVSFDVRTGRWTVTRRSDGVRKVVDGASGAVVP